MALHFSEVHKTGVEVVASVALDQVEISCHNHQAVVVAVVDVLRVAYEKTDMVHVVVQEEVVVDRTKDTLAVVVVKDLEGGNSFLDHVDHMGLGLD